MKEEIKFVVSGVGRQNTEIEEEHDFSAEIIYEGKIDEEVKREDFNPIFIDGTIKYHFSGNLIIGGREILTELLSICIGYIGNREDFFKIKKFLSITYDEEIKKIIEEKKKIKIEGFKEPFEISGKKGEEILKDEEFEFIKKIQEDHKNKTVIIDGPIYFNYIENISGNVIGCVKRQVRKIQEIEEKTKKLREKEYIIVEAKKNEKQKYLMIINIGSGINPIMRFDFVVKEKEEKKIEEKIKEKINTVKKVLKFVSSIGDRAPQNLVPIRILERKMQSKIKSEILLPKIKDKNLKVELTN